MGMGMEIGHVVVVIMIWHHRFRRSTDRHLCMRRRLDLDDELISRFEPGMISEIAHCQERVMAWHSMRLFHHQLITMKEGMTASASASEVRLGLDEYDHLSKQTGSCSPHVQCNTETSGRSGNLIMIRRSVTGVNQKGTTNVSPSKKSCLPLALTQPRRGRRHRLKSQILTN